MKLSKTMLLCAFIPFLLTGCAKKISKQEAVDFAKQNYTSTEKKDATCHKVGQTQTMEAMPEYFSNQFEAFDKYEETKVIPMSADMIADCDESKFVFNLDGKYLTYSYTYSGNDIKEYFKEAHGIDFPKDSIISGTCTGSSLLNECGYCVKEDQSFNFEIEYQENEKKNLGKVKYTYSYTYVFK